jgi:hypothetical protein
MASYTIFDNGGTRRGDAQKLLEEIRIQAARQNDEIARMTVDQYADALIEDAPYFLDDALLKALEAQPFVTKFDRALNYLSQMPTSGVRIMTVQAA